MTNTLSPPTPRNRWLRRLGTLLTVASVLLAAGAVIAFANGYRADRAGAVGHLHATEVATATIEGQWHWLDADGGVGAPLGKDAVIVPGDRIGFVTADGALTSVRFALPAESENDTQGRSFAIPDGNDIYAVAQPRAGRLEFTRSPLWLVVAAGALASFAAGGMLIQTSLRPRPVTASAAP